MDVMVVLLEQNGLCQGVFFLSANRYMVVMTNFSFRCSQCSRMEGSRVSL